MPKNNWLLETKKMIDDFKDKFSVCEIVYKVVLEDHQFNKYGVHKERLQVTGPMSRFRTN